MIAPSGPFTRPLPAVALLAALLVVQPAWAQEEFDVEVEVENAPPAPRDVFVLNENNFNAWAFGNPAGPAAARATLESSLKLWLAELDRSCSLSPAQSEKLQLAGRGDIKRFFDLVDEKRRLYLGKEIDHRKLGEVHGQIVSLQTVLAAGLFGDDSLFARTIRNTLDEEQFARYQRQLAERRANLYRARVELEVASLSKSLGLRAEQCRRLADLLLAETNPPRAFGRYEHYVIWFQASKIPEEKVREVLDETQWRSFHAHANRIKQAEPLLRSNGLLPKDEPAEESLEASP
jgi:hypothetical protein